MRITNCKWKDILRSSIRSSIYLFIWNGLFIPCTHSFRSIAISPRTIRNPSMNKLKSNNFPDKARFDRVKWQKGRLMHESRYSNQEWRVHLQEVEQGTCVRLQWQLCLPGTPITNPPNSIRDLTESRSLWRTPLMLSSLLLPRCRSPPLHVEYTNFRLRDGYKNWGVVLIRRERTEFFSIRFQICDGLQNGNQISVMLVLAFYWNLELILCTYPLMKN